MALQCKVFGHRLVKVCDIPIARTREQHSELHRCGRCGYLHNAIADGPGDLRIFEAAVDKVIIQPMLNGTSTNPDTPVGLIH